MINKDTENEESSNAKTESEQIKIDAEKISTLDSMEEEEASMK